MRNGGGAVPAATGNVLSPNEDRRAERASDVLIQLGRRRRAFSPEAVIRTSLVSVKCEKERNHNRNESQVLSDLGALNCRFFYPKVQPPSSFCETAAELLLGDLTASLAGMAPFRYRY